MKDLSPRQKEALEYIMLTISQRNMPPTYREIGDALGISSTNGVSDHVKALVRKGYLERPSQGAGMARGLILTDKARGPTSELVVEVPLLGQVAAGSPILADENYERTLRLDPSMTDGARRVFALRVRGESMINEGILEGDIVIVRQQSSANDGDIVVALIDGEATVKLFFRERHRIRLQPANDSMMPFYIDETSFASIQGKVIGVYRSY
jgi:repressor LexA